MLSVHNGLIDAELGSDTTATAMSATFFYLSRNPECYQKLAREIRSAFTTGGQIKTGPRLAGCSYLRACIDEAMRMSPPVPGTLWRTRDRGDTQPLIIDGYPIPHGTLFGVSAYAIQHNEAYFQDPFTFRPERWLETKSSPEQATQQRLMRDAFAVFSVGPCSCAGKAMAYMEASIVVAKTLWYFDFQTAPPHAESAGDAKWVVHFNEFPLEDIFTARHNGPSLVFSPRADHLMDS